MRSLLLSSVYVRHTIKGEGSLWLIAECDTKLCRIALINFDMDEYNSSSENVRDALCQRVLKEHEQLFIAT